MKARFHLFASLLAVAVAVTLLTIPAAAASANSNIGNVQLNATLNESLTVTVSAGTTVNFALAPNTASNAGSTTSTVNTAWVLKPGRNNIAVWAYFTSATGALTSTTGGTATIPSSAVGVHYGKPLQCGSFRNADRQHYDHRQHQHQQQPDRHAGVQH